MTDPAYCDTHAHLSYVAERSGAEALERIAARYSGNGAFILDPGVDHDDFEARKSLLGKYDFVLLAAGIWPDAESPSRLPDRLEALETSIRDPACLAVGECGLDYHWMHGSEAEQLELFMSQIELAILYDKPLIVHSREAHADTLRTIGEFSGKIPVIMHCFGYDREAAAEYLSLGCYLSFAGNVTFRNAGGLREALKLVPDDRLLLETDAPYMNPEPFRGKPSTPLDIERTYQVAASVRDCDGASLSRLILRNMERILSIKK
ncbi:MAG: TatD family deoxyribonuclease [Spirochaetales bacterium]|nr:MAG: TatD family deoxyribonuclease [Spirochaetales bacterium]